MDVEILVVGAGPSGLAVATQLKKLGVGDVLVVDREQEAGGVPRHCWHTGFGLRDLKRVLSGPAYARRRIEMALRVGVQVCTGVTVTDWLGDLQVQTTSAQGIQPIRARAIVLATGCRERPRAARLVPGSRPGGIFTTGSLQRYVYEFHHPVGDRAVVVGAEHVSFSAVLTLRHAGVRVAGMVTEHPRHQSFPVYTQIARGLSKFPLYTNSRITHIEGKTRLEGVEITDDLTGETAWIACDTLVFTGDWIPDREVARKMGVTLDHGTRGPEVDGHLRTSMRGVFAVGNLVHPGETADTAALSGSAAARHVVDFLAAGQWLKEPGVRFSYDRDDFRWVAPNVIVPGQQYGAIIFRVARVLQRPGVIIRQGERTLWVGKFRRLLPNLPYTLRPDFLQHISIEDGPVRLSLV